MFIHCIHSRKAIMMTLPQLADSHQGPTCRTRASLALLALSCVGFGITAIASALAPVVVGPHLAESGRSGGLVVYVGGEDLVGTGWTPGPAFLVHQLVPDVDQLEFVRDGIRARGLYGQVSASHFSGERLPYAEDTVNVLFISNDLMASVADGEIHRVLSPGGVAYRFNEDGAVSAIKKDWPEDMDRWTHARYNATANAVSQDGQVGPPRYLQWQAGPRWNRSVKTSVMISDAGRIYYMLDDAHFASDRTRWSLIARDAFNGIYLWRRELERWPGAGGGKKAGPMQTDRKLIADHGRIYAVLAGSGPIHVLDGGTGEDVRVLADSEDTEEMVLSDGILIALVDPNTLADLRRGNHRAMSLRGYCTDSGDLLWDEDMDMVIPLTLAADSRQVVFHDGTHIRSLDLRTGEARWQSVPTGHDVEFEPGQWPPNQPGARAGTIVVARNMAPTLILYDDVVAFAGGERINVFCAEDGTELWQDDFAASNYSVPVDVFGFGGRIWGPDPGMDLWRPLDDSLDFIMFDRRTGEQSDPIRGHYGSRFQHHRCNQMKAVRDQIIAARVGVEFLDTNTGAVQAHHWVRGSCYYGVMPANHLLYVPPHDCACHVRAKLSGLFSFRASRPDRLEEPEPQLQIGPAYGRAPVAAEAGGEDWPTYRADARRTGRARTVLGTEPVTVWERRLGGDLTAPVSAGDLVLVGSSSEHTLYALAAEDGALRWSFTLDGPVDSPPTIHQGMVLCGGRDGYVYALRAEDGALAWRFRAAPEPRWIVSEERLESAWPVHGSVLVENGVAYFAAGRSSYVDGGIHLYGLDPHSGEVRYHSAVDSREIGTPQEFLEKRIDDVSIRAGGPSPVVKHVQHDPSQQVDEMGIDGFLNDILTSDGQHVFMRHQAFGIDEELKWVGASPEPRLHSPDGFLSDVTTFRLQWIYAPTFTSLSQGAFFDSRLSRMLFPSGRILVEGDEVIYGYGDNFYEEPQFERGGDWAVFGAAKQQDVPLNLQPRQYRGMVMQERGGIQFSWHHPLPIHAWAMLKSGDILYLAGPAAGEGMEAGEAALRGRTGASLIALSASDGSTLSEVALPSTPVWDGMAAANGRLFVATRDGRLLALKAVE